MKYFIIGTIAMVAGVCSGPVRELVQARHAPTLDVDPAGGPNRLVLSEVQALGYVEPRTGLRQLSFEMGGVIDACACEIGDEVRCGDLLMVLRNDDLRTAADVAEVQLRVARAERDKLLSGVHPSRIEMVAHEQSALNARVEYLANEFARSQRLLASDAVAETQFASISNDLRIAKARSMRTGAQLRYLKNRVTEEDRTLADRRVELAEAELEQARAHLTRSYLRAPFDGVVLDILHRKGEAVDKLRSEPVILFGAQGPSRIRAEVDERHVQRLRPGMQAVVSGHNLLGHSYPGQVSRVTPCMGTRTVFREDGRERRSLDVAEVIVELEEPLVAPVGLLVDVTIDATSVE